MEPIRIYDGNAAPFAPFWGMKNAAESESGEPEIELYGPISEYSWWGDEVTPAKFKSDLYAHGKGGAVTVRINSGGGDVFAASVMRAILVDYPGRVTTRIDGLCASAATYVAMAGDVVKMQDTAFFMIHDPSAMAFGTVEDFKQIIAVLKTVKDEIILAYQAKTSLSHDHLATLMADETWMTAKDAKELGFIDEVVSLGMKQLQPIANAAVMNCLKNYTNVPLALLSSIPAPVITEDAGEKNLVMETVVKELKDYLQIFG